MDHERPKCNRNEDVEEALLAHLISLTAVHYSYPGSDRQLGSWNFQTKGTTMALDKDLLAILCCPETKQPVTLADTALIHRLNEAIKGRRLQNKGKQAVTEPVEAGLLRADAKVLYPIRENIPVMLIEEGIPLEQVG